MPQLKYTVLGCNFSQSEQRIIDQFIKGINKQKYWEELLTVTSDNTPLDELTKVACKLKVVKLSTNALQKLCTHVDAVNKTEQTKANVKEVPTMGETVVEAEEVAGLLQVQQMEHVGTVVPR